MAKIALKGFADLSYFPVSADTASAYSAGERVQLPGAQSCSPQDNRNSYEIVADDALYDRGSDYKSTTLAIKVAEMELSSLADMLGSAYDAETGTLYEGAADNCAEVALTFSALRSDGGKRMFRYYNARLIAYKAEHRTRGDGGEIASYELTFSCAGRLCDGRVRATRDTLSVPTQEELAFLATVDALE